MNLILFTLLIFFYFSNIPLIVITYFYTYLKCVNNAIVKSRYVLDYIYASYLEL